MAYFGSNIPRFNEKQKGTDLGPGQYRVNGRLKGNMLSAAGSSTFKSPERKPIFGDGADKPGPCEYENQKVGFGVSGPKRQNAFGIKEKRFTSDATLPPGPGQYAPKVQAVTVNDEKRAHAGMASQTERKIQTNNADNPGVGNYNVNEHLALGV